MVVVLVTPHTTVRQLKAVGVARLGTEELGMLTVSQLFISTGDGSVHHHNSSAPTSGTYQGWDLRSQTDLRPLTSWPPQTSRPHPRLLSQSSGLSLLQTQFPACLFFTIRNVKLGKHFSPGASEMGSLVFCPSSCEGRPAQVICACENTPSLTGLFGHLRRSVPLCLFDFVRVGFGCRALMSTGYLSRATIQPRNEFVLLP